jgi:hypothetical protein
MADPVTRWAVKTHKRTIYGKTKAETMRRAADAIAKAEAQGQGWSLLREWHHPRTRWPVVLVIDRAADQLVAAFNNTLQGRRLHWTDSCGSRSAWWYGPAASDDYEDAQDLPPDVFDELRSFLREAKCSPRLILRREDPGVGIYLSDLDDPA